MMLLVAVAIPVVLAFVLFGVAAVMDRWLDRPFAKGFERSSPTVRRSTRLESDFDERAFIAEQQSPPAAAAGS